MSYFFGGVKMSISTIIVLLTIAVLYYIYVSLIHRKNKVKEAFSGIDVQLKKRYDLIPNLLQCAAKFMEHEKSLLADITKLRTEAMNTSLNESPKHLSSIENKLSSKLREFSISVENYPDLKSNQTMVQLMDTMNTVEENIAAARRFYNSAVNDLNNAIEIFPSSVVAKWLKIESKELFETPEEEKKSINVGDYLK